MAKYFKKVSSFEDLKKQFKELLKLNHPDNGGDVKIMQEINIEYDALFAIWKKRAEEETGKKVEETASSSIREFYTDFGWEGSKHNWDRSLKEVAVIVRTFVKEKYPTYKFSVRTSYASMCQELHVDLKESPVEIYKTYEELNEADKNQLIKKMRYNHLFTLNAWSESELKAEFERIWEEEGDYYKCLNEVTSEVINEVDDFVHSYNYCDCDGSIDYFHVDFYYFGCVRNNGRNIKIVPRTARIPKNKKSTSTTSETIHAPICKKLIFDVSQDEDTRDGSTLWVVKIKSSLSKAEYIQVSKKIQTLGGYYSKFKHGFIFRYEPFEKLQEVS